MSCISSEHAKKSADYQNKLFFPIKHASLCMYQVFYFKVTLLGIIYVTELSSLYIYIQAICYIYQDMSVRIDFTEGYSFMGRGGGHGKDNHGP